MTPFRQQQAKRIIFVLLVFTLISSLSAAASVTGNAFAKKSSNSDGGGSKDKGGSSSDNGGGGGSSKDKGGSSSDNGGGSGSSDTGGGSSSDNTGSGGTTAGGSDTGGGSSDTGSTSTPSSTTAEPPATEGSTSTPPPAAENQQTTCPDGTTVDPTTACPTTTTTEQQNTAPETQGEQTTCPGGTTVDPTTGDCPSTTSNPATTLAPNQKQCSEGQHFDPLILGCVPDNPPTSSTTTGGATTTGNTGTTMTPASTQGALDLQVPDKDGNCPQGYRLINTNVCAKDASTPSSSSSGGGGATTSTPPATQTGTTKGAAVHINSDGTLGTDANTDGSCPQGSDHTDNPKQCKVISMQANQDGTCPVHTSHFQGADAKQCFVDTALQTGNTGTALTTAAPADCTKNPTDPSCTNAATNTPPVKCAADEYYQPTAGVCFSAKVVNPDTHQCGVEEYHKISEGSCESDDTPLPSGGCVTGRHLHTSDLGTTGCLTDKFIDKPASGCPEDYGATDYDSNLCAYRSIPIQGRCGTGWHFVDVISKKECTRDTTKSKDVGDTVIDIGLPSATGVCETHGSTKVGDRCVIDAVDIGPISSSGLCSSGTKVGDRCMIIPEPNVIAKPDGSCIPGYHTSALPTTETGGYKTCDHDIITQVSMPGNVGSGTTTTIPEPPAELEVPPTSGGSCPPGTHGGGTPTTVTCLAQKAPDGSFILPSLPQGPGSTCDKGYIPVSGKCLADIFCPTGMTKLREQCISNKLLPATTTTTALPAQTSNSGGGGASTTPTNTGSATPGTTPMKTGTETTTTPTNTGNPNTTPTTTTTTTTPPTSTTSTTSSTTNVINRGGSSGGGGGSGGGSTTSSPPAAQGSNALLTYVNSVNKITMKYPSTWTKIDLVGNPRIPVMFNAPTTIATAATTPSTASAKTSFVISITPAASSLDSFTQQQLNTLTQSKAIKYTITNTNAKLLTPPTGITAFREVSYDAVKNDNVPLKGAAIFFVNGGTGYSLLYLAKQTEYTQNIPMVQQMVNSFQVGAAAGGSTGSGPVQSVAAASSR